MNSMLKKVLLSVFIAAIAMIATMQFSAEPAQAFGNCVPWCRGDGPVDRTTWSGTDFRIRNNTSEDVWVAMVYFDPGGGRRCQNALCNVDDVWMLARWYKIPAYLSKELISNYSNQYIYIYAEGSKGGRWGGDDYYAWVDNRSVDIPVNLAGSNSGADYKVGFHKVDLGNRNNRFTFNLNN